MYRLKLMATGVDVWLAVIIVVHEMGKPIPWWLWTLLIVEFLGSVAITVQGKREE